MKHNIIVLLSIVIPSAIAVFIAIKVASTTYQDNSPYFVVIEMVQCKGNICNAVLEMDDIAILIPYDSTNVRVGDTIYLVK